MKFRSTFCIPPTFVLCVPLLAVACGGTSDSTSDPDQEQGISSLDSTDESAAGVDLEGECLGEPASSTESKYPNVVASGQFLYFDDGDLTNARSTGGDISVVSSDAVRGLGVSDGYVYGYVVNYNDSDEIYRAAEGDVLAPWATIADVSESGSDIRSMHVTGQAYVVVVLEEEDEFQIALVSKDDADVQLLPMTFLEAPKDVLLDGQYLYWLEAMGDGGIGSAQPVGLMRLEVGESEPLMVAETSASVAVGRPFLVADGEYLYFTRQNGLSGEVMKLPLAGGDPVPLATVETLLGSSTGGTLFANSDTIFVNKTDSVVAINKATGNIEWLAPCTHRGIAPTDSALFVAATLTEASGGGLFSLPLPM